MERGEPRDELVGLFVKTARAHHAATGGVNPQWAEWYAKTMLEELNQLVGTSMTEEELTGWLVRADERYRQEEPDRSWPKAYAQWMRAEFT